ncbi:TM1266 family iron-only hydrogenase system putative regulator [Sunxiuqinia sp. sy24]|uniref:TM1266 family iron-only hydrogenase system putative regulator n=1 Tax=Sunxiuqinia sp. sy24 TaxID=3461495 RepID=UPI004045BE58
MTAEKRLGFVGIIVEDRTNSATLVNELLSKHADFILARTGIPRAKEQTSVITLVVDCTTDELGKLNGRLGAIKGVQVKSGMAKNE